MKTVVKERSVLLRPGRPTSGELDRELLINPWLRRGDLCLIHGATASDRTWISMILAKAMLSLQPLKIGPWEGAEKDRSVYYLPSHSLKGKDPHGETLLTDACPLSRWNSLTVAIPTRQPVFSPLYNRVFGGAYYQAETPLDLNLWMHSDALMEYLRRFRDIGAIVLDDMPSLFRNRMKVDDFYVQDFLSWLRYPGEVAGIFLSETTEGLPEGVFDSIVELESKEITKDWIRLAVSLADREKIHKPFELEIYQPDEFAVCWR